MTFTPHRLLTQRIQDRFKSLLTPLIKILAKSGISPNTFTLTGVIITSMAAAALILRQPRIGGCLILIGGLCDSIDGSLARYDGKPTRFGALLDSAMDRYSEFIMFFGIIIYFMTMKDYRTSVVAFAALSGSIMVSYSRARAESLGFEAKSGFMQRAERIVFLGAGALFHPALFKLSIWLVAIFANFTALQRIYHAYQQNETKTIKDK
ncbi:MAG: CDP-alcohol phosphatidyltransferase family protein [Desulfobacterales bacterium]|jgi:CDP-diacylglycerol--glycerol-3-phosphate 3-phosphatidyltransferase